MTYVCNPFIVTSPEYTHLQAQSDLRPSSTFPSFEITQTMALSKSISQMLIDFHPLIDTLRTAYPRAKELDCDKMLGSKRGATTHATSVHDQVKWPCPLAEEKGCTTEFSTKSVAAQRGFRVARVILGLWKGHRDFLVHTQRISTVIKRLPRVETLSGVRKRRIREKNGRVPWQKRKGMP